MFHSSLFDMHICVKFYKSTQLDCSAMVEKNGATIMSIKSEF